MTVLGPLMHSGSRRTSSSRAWLSHRRQERESVSHYDAYTKSPADLSLATTPSVAEVNGLHTAVRIPVRAVGVVNRAPATIPTVAMFLRIAAMDAMDRVIVSTSPEDTVAALRLLKVLEECRQMRSTEAEAWRRRIMGWARYHGGVGWVRLAALGATFLFFFSAVERRGSRARPSKVVINGAGLNFGEA